MRTVFCYPFYLKGNRYIDIHKTLWGELGLNVSPLKSMMNIRALSNRKNNFAVLNWLEDTVIRADGSSRLITFLHKLFLLLSARVFCKHVIWVRHNVKPHLLNGDKPLYLRMFERIYFHVADCIVTHADVECHHARHHIVPHPLYREEFDVDNPIERTDLKFDFVFFGAITKYKNLDGLLETWPSNQKLLMAGACKDEDLRHRLDEIISRRGLLINWIDKFISDEELNDLLRCARVVLIPHASGTMIVSGAFYHAISFGCEVVMAKNNFYSYLSGFFPYVHTLDGLHDDGVMTSLLSKDKREMVINKAAECFGAEKVKEEWAKILLS